MGGEACLGDCMWENTNLVDHHLCDNIPGMDINGDEGTDDAAHQLWQHSSYQLCQFVQILGENATQH